MTREIRSSIGNYRSVRANMLLLLLLSFLLPLLT